MVVVSLESAKHGAHYSPFGLEEDREASGLCCGVRRGWVLPRPTFCQAAFMLVYVGLVVVLMLDSYSARLSFDLILQALAAVPPDEPAPLCLLFFLLAAGAVLAAFPTPLLCVLGGFLLSRILGPYLSVLAASCIVAVSVTLASLLAFLVSRAVLRPWASELLRASDTLEGLDEALREQGLKLNLLLRLSPLVPCGLTNLAMGLTATRTDDFAVGCLIGILPCVIVLGWFGSGLTSMDQVGPYATRWRLELLVLHLVGVLAVLGAALLMHRATRKATEAVRKRKASLCDSYNM